MRYIIILMALFVFNFYNNVTNAFELEEVIPKKSIFCPHGSADLDGDGTDELVRFSYQKVKGKLFYLDKRVDIYKYNKKRNEIEHVWRSQDLSAEGGDGFDGKIRFGDMNGNGRQEIILFGYRWNDDEESRGYPYEGNIYVFEWNGTKYRQITMTKEMLTYKKKIVVTNLGVDQKDSILINQRNKLYAINLEGNSLVSELISDRQLEGSTRVDYAVADFDGDGQKEIVFEDRNKKNDTHELKMVKYDKGVKEFKILYEEPTPKTQEGYIEINDVLETEDGSRVVLMNYDKQKRYIKIGPDLKKESKGGRKIVMKKMGVDSAVIKKKSVKYSGLKLLDARKNLFADIDGDGKDEVVSCLKKGGVAVYRIKGNGKNK